MKGTMCCYQRPIQKPGPLMISGCISTYEFSSLNISESAKATYTPPSRRGLFQEGACIFQQDNTKQNIVFITKVWLYNISLKKAILFS